MNLHKYLDAMRSDVSSTQQLIFFVCDFYYTPLNVGNLAHSGPLVYLVFWLENDLERPV